MPNLKEFLMNSDTDENSRDADKNIVANLVYRAIKELSSAVPGLTRSLILDRAPLNELREAIRFLKEDLNLISGGNLYFNQEKRSHNYVYGRDRDCSD